MRSGKHYSWRNTGFSQTDDHPVVNVSWNDAYAFCSWLSMKEGAVYRLPTEAEWEYACRAGNKTYFGHGRDDEAINLKPYANVADLSLGKKMPEWFAVSDWDDHYPFTAPVGQFKPNDFGLYDMQGNVAEWCDDWYDANTYRGVVQSDPPGSATGTHRVRRGGCWHDAPFYSGASHRGGPSPDNPLINRPDYRCSFYGFRVVRVVP